MGVRDDLRETRDAMKVLLWTGRSWLGKVGVVVIGVVGAYAALAITLSFVIDSPETTTQTVLDTTTTTIASDPTVEETEADPTLEEAVESDPCGEMRIAVETYNTLSPSGSREGYLLALHTFQRECPDEALAAGLDASFLKQCEPGGFTQENCTMYRSRP